MGAIKKTIAIVSVLLLILGGFGGMYIYSLSKVEIRDIKINELQDISLSGFTLGGYIQLYNGGFLPVIVNHISYEVVLEASGKQLVQGYIDGKKISSKQTANFPFSNKINWVPTSEVAWGLITPGKTYAKISGSVYVADLKFVEFKIPFEKRVDLEQYIRQFAKAKIEQAVDKVTSTVTNVVDSIG